MAVENLPKHNDRTAIVMIKIDSFGDFPSRDRKEDCAAPVITRLTRYYVEPGKWQWANAYSSIVFECYAGFVGVGCFDENEFMFPHFIENALCECGLLKEEIRYSTWQKQCYSPYHSMQLRWIPCIDSWGRMPQSRRALFWCIRWGYFQNFEQQLDHSWLRIANWWLLGHFPELWPQWWKWEVFKRQVNSGLTSGKNAFLVNVIGYVSCTTGVNWSILGYMSRGEMVPEVMTTLLKRSNTGFMARDGSRQLISGISKSNTKGKRY